MHDYENYKLALKLSNKTIKTQKRNLERKIASNIKYDPKAFTSMLKLK